MKVSSMLLYAKIEVLLLEEKEFKKSRAKKVLWANALANFIFVLHCQSVVMLPDTLKKRMP